MEASYELFLKVPFYFPLQKIWGYVGMFIELLFVGIETYHY